MTRLLVFGALAGLVGWLIVSWLISALGWTVIMLLVLWGVVGVSVLHATGKVRLSPWWASWFDQIIRVPVAAAPALSPTVAPVASSPAVAPSSAATAPPRLTPAEATDAAITRINALHGIDGAKQKINDLIAMGVQASEHGQAAFGVQAPATMLLLQGPGGTGKTEAAQALGLWLYGAGIVAEAHAVTLTSAEIADQSPGQAYAIAQMKAEAALGGVLLIDPADWLVRERFDTGGNNRDPFSTEIARGLMSVISAHRSKLVIVATGPAGLRLKMQGRAGLQQDLLNRIHLEVIDFDELSADSLARVFMDHVKAQRVRLHPDLQTRLPSMIQTLKNDAGPAFDNAHTIRRWFDDVSSYARRRSGHSGTTELTAQDFRLETA